MPPHPSQLNTPGPSTANRQRKSRVCYLCGGNLGAERSRDHVPPLQIFPERLREGLNLLTVPVHKECNQQYQSDEEYFVVTLSPIAGDSPEGRALWQDLSRKFERPQGRRLGHMVRKEFYTIELPGGMRAKRFDGRRVRRVIWKVVRGLFFIQEGHFLPVQTPHQTHMFGPHDSPDDDIRQILGYALSAESRAAEPGIFDYRYRDHRYPDFPDLGATHLWFWAMLFWNTVISLTTFHDPECTCSRCSPTLHCQG
jgi:hypothetical protein